MNSLTAASVQPTRRAPARSHARSGRPRGVTRQRRERVEISSPRARGRVGLPRAARRRWRLLQGRPRPARSVQRRPGRPAPRTLRARLRAGVPGFRRRSRPQARAARALRAGRKQPARPGRGCPRSHQPRPRATALPPVPREMNGPRAPPRPGGESGGPRRRPRRAAEAAPGGPRAGAASRSSLPIRPRPAPPGPRPAPGAPPPPAHPSSWRCAPGTLRWSGCRGRASTRPGSGGRTSCLSSSWWARRGRGERRPRGWRRRGARRRVPARAAQPGDSGRRWNSRGDLLTAAGARTDCAAPSRAAAEAAGA